MTGYQPPLVSVYRVAVDALCFTATQLEEQNYYDDGHLIPGTSLDGRDRMLVKGKAFS